MNQLYMTFVDTAVAAVPMVPVFLWLKVRRYRDWKTTLWYLSFVLYLCGVYAVAGLPTAVYIRFQPRFNWIPFRYMFTAWETTVLNVVLFLPLGFFLPLLWQRFASLLRVMVTGFALSMGVELLQLFTFRATDVNDLMTNTLGAALGFFCARLLARLLPISPPRRSARELTVLLGAVFLVMFFLHPLLTGLLGIP